MTLSTREQKFPAREQEDLGVRPVRNDAFDSGCLNTNFVHSDYATDEQKPNRITNCTVQVGLSPGTLLHHKQEVSRVASEEAEVQTNAPSPNESSEKENNKLAPKGAGHRATRSSSNGPVLSKLTCRSAPLHCKGPSASQSKRWKHRLLVDPNSLRPPWQMSGTPNQIKSRTVHSKYVQL